jgi:hypothetical protein
MALMSALLNAAVAVSLFTSGHAQQPLPAPVGLRVEMLLESAAPTLNVGTATPRFSFVSWQFLLQLHQSCMVVSIVSWSGMAGGAKGVLHHT